MTGSRSGKTGIDGLSWLDALAAEDRAVNLGGDGYPSRYTAQARYIIGAVTDGPPGARATWAMGPHDIVTDEWEGTTAIDEEVAEACRPDEWLLIEAWDES